MLLGGFERGSVVGISAEEEDGVGVTVSLLVPFVCEPVERKS